MPTRPDTFTGPINIDAMTVMRVAAATLADESRLKSQLRSRTLELNLLACGRTEFFDMKLLGEAMAWLQDELPNWRPPAPAAEGPAANAPAIVVAAAEGPGPAPAIEAAAEGPAPAIEDAAGAPAANVEPPFTQWPRAADMKGCPLEVIAEIANKQKHFTRIRKMAALTGPNQADYVTERARMLAKAWGLLGQHHFQAVEAKRAAEKRNLDKVAETLKSASKYVNRLQASHVEVGNHLTAAASASGLVRNAVGQIPVLEPPAKRSRAR